MAQFPYLDDEDDAQPERDTRAEVSIVCEARQGTRPWRKVRLEDLSPGGFRVAWMPDVRADTPLRIRIPGMQMLTAKIVWQRDNALGCAFEEPLYPAVFEHLVRTAG
ncbi:PilZ domain-containing protein [Novosphingobium sp. 9]|uniref:PilZ domain-containing protein n=1 Tax=Novosphingobium sp. 9 TaxID=2025349 RepID=UPI0021B5EC14|nr:PilZ domain-containing protein [Novosphingobium sp. 9]